MAQSTNWLWTILILIIIIVIIALLIHLYFYPAHLLWPYNCLVNQLVESKTFYSNAEKERIFPQCIKFEQHWRQIRQEAQRVIKDSADNVWKQFHSAEASFWQGWTAFTMRLYGVNVTENLAKCPTVAKILRQCPHVHTAVFSILEPGKIIPPHYGPFKGVLRYHLGLIIPKEKKRRCYIKVGPDKYDWQEGQGVLFDETFLHSAHNQTSQYRVVLYLDIPRPMPYWWLQKINSSLMWLIQNSPQNQAAIAQTKRLARQS